MAREFAKQFYKSKEWGRVREYVLRRDRYLCVECGDPAEEVHHVIHLNPNNIFDPMVSLNPDNLKCLCRACHFDAHRGEHGKGRQKEEDYPYEFDSDGNLIEKKSPPGRDKK